MKKRGLFLNYSPVLSYMLWICFVCLYHSNFSEVIKIISGLKLLKHNVINIKMSFLDTFENAAITRSTFFNNISHNTHRIVMRSIYVIPCFRGQGLR